MYDSVAILIGNGAATYDRYGNETIAETETEVYVQPRGVYQAEFYNAAQLGLKPSVTLHLASREDYAGQKRLRFENVEYNVIRVDWTAQRDGLNLVCEERVNNG